MRASNGCDCDDWRHLVVVCAYIGHGGVHLLTVYVCVCVCVCVCVHWMCLRAPAHTNTTTKQGGEAPINIKLLEPPPLLDSAPAVQFNKASFSYTGTTPFLLKDVDMSVRHGTRVALVGANGQLRLG